MKLAYLLQEVYRVPLGYRFTLYTYGPYSLEVLGDLERLKFRGGVNITYLGNEAGFRITPGQRAEQIIEYNNAVRGYDDQIDSLVQRFGHFRAKDLELRATTVYMWNNVRPSGDTAVDEVVKLVHVLKPRFGEQEIRSAVDELVENDAVKIFA